MFISVLDLLKIGIGPSSSHTMGPMLAAKLFRESIAKQQQDLHIQCRLLGSLAFTGEGHQSHYAVLLGLNGHTALSLQNLDIQSLCSQLMQQDSILIDKTPIKFSFNNDIIFDKQTRTTQHPNTMIFQLFAKDGKCLYEKVYFSIGGGFISTPEEIQDLSAPLKLEDNSRFPYPFSTANEMLEMAEKNHINIAQMKRANEECHCSAAELDAGLNRIWETMRSCIQSGLETAGTLPGELGVSRRAKDIYCKIKQSPQNSDLNDWLCCYAMAVNEENAAGHIIVTAPTNGAAGVIPAVLYYMVEHKGFTQEQIHQFLLTASAIGGIIKQNSSISGAEVGCQGEVGSAAAMAAAGLCAALGGSPLQVENAAEIALEHHLGLTCDPVAGLVQIPCIERNGFGAIKAYSASSLALHGTGQHFVSLDKCIAAMKQTGEEMSHKFKETALGGLAVSVTEC